MSQRAKNPAKVRAGQLGGVQSGVTRAARSAQVNAPVTAKKSEMSKASRNSLLTIDSKPIEKPSPATVDSMPSSLKQSKKRKLSNMLIEQQEEVDDETVKRQPAQRKAKSKTSPISTPRGSSEIPKVLRDLQGNENDDDIYLPVFMVDDGTKATYCIKLSQTETERHESFWSRVSNLFQQIRKTEIDAELNDDDEAEEVMVTVLPSHIKKAMFPTLFDSIGNLRYVHDKPSALQKKQQKAFFDMISTAAAEVSLKLESNVPLSDKKGPVTYNEAVTAMMRMAAQTTPASISMDAMDGWISILFELGNQAQEELSAYGSIISSLAREARQNLELVRRGCEFIVNMVDHTVNGEDSLEDSVPEVELRQGAKLPRVIVEAGGDHQCECRDCDPQYHEQLRDQIRDDLRQSVLEEVRTEEAELLRQKLRESTEFHAKQVEWERGELLSKGNEIELRKAKEKLREEVLKEADDKMREERLQLNDMVEAGVKQRLTAMMQAAGGK